MTLPRFNFNDFPIETDQAQIEVIFPVGRHVLELVVEDSAGLQSAPSTVVITVEQAPPVIDQIQPNSRQQGETVQAQISGENLLGISEVSFAGSGVSATILPGCSNTSVFIEMIILPQATTGSHNFTITTPGGTATSPAGVEFMVTPAVAPVITIRPASGPVGTTVNIEGAGFAPSSQVSITFDRQRALSPRMIEVLGPVWYSCLKPPWETTFLPPPTSTETPPQPPSGWSRFLRSSLASFRTAPFGEKLLMPSLPEVACPGPAQSPFPALE
jgi:hypothetical protein